MSTNYIRYNDGSSNPPRLRVGHSLWSLIKLPMNAETEWTLDEKFSRVKEAGFEAVECWLDDSNEQEVKAALDRHGLRLVLGHRPFKLEDTRATVERAVRLGADFIFAQPANAYAPLETVVDIIRDGLSLAHDRGIPMFVEVHRNNFTENIPQTIELIEKVPDIRFTGDLSHFVVVGEFYGWPDEGAANRMMPILERTSHLHGRISNGEAVQVDVGDGSGQTAQFFVELWSIAMRHWLQGAGPGDVFPFTSELGPPRYAITLPDGSEFSDRWEQSLVMKRLAEQAWEKAQS
ncbi:MAG: TIM barrel protein [Abitibacteriaceae bacterium]|nr:TIM barrel protein [Abditibacteriaceae bacterium]MBV9865395.1 TIM barrel protein [Abditibacteriaceae bacterium]